MQLTPLLSLYAVITAFFGLALLGFPSQLMGVYGASLDTLATILSRFIGGLFAGLAVMAWMARAAEAGKARNAMVLGLTVLNGFSAVVAVMAALSGVFNALAWAQAGLYGLFTVLFVVAGRPSMSPGAGAGNGGSPEARWGPPPYKRLKPPGALRLKDHVIAWP